MAISSGSECQSCDGLRKEVDRLKRRLHSLSVRMAAEKKLYGMPDRLRICREIKRRDPDAPHWCPSVQSRKLKRLIKGEPCRLMPEIGIGAVVLMRCESIRLEHLILKTDTCWGWIGRLNKAGYGVFHWESGNWSAHRFVYTLLSGPIGYGMVLDHTCLRKSCVNPDHLEQITQAENMRRLWKIQPSDLVSA